MDKELSKIDRIKNATIELVAENGFNQISVSDIAKHANVSTGYLYRHYEGKKELIVDIINELQSIVIEEVKEILLSIETVEDVCNEIVDYHYHVYKNHPEKLKFMVTLVNDFGLTSMQEQQDYFRKLCELFYENFLQKKDVRANTHINEVYIALIVIPLQSFALQLRGSFILNQLDEMANVEMIKKISLRILKEDK